MTQIRIKHLPLEIRPDSSRVILRPFIPGSKHRIKAIIKRALQHDADATSAALEEVLDGFVNRHRDVHAALHAHYKLVSPHIAQAQKLTREQQLMIGSLFTGEYALEAAALFNPSIVADPDQRLAASGGLRIIMSLRSCGEGHVSSISFRGGAITTAGTIVMDEQTRFVSLPELIKNPRYNKRIFFTKLKDLGFSNACSRAVSNALADEFTREELYRTIADIRQRKSKRPKSVRDTLFEIEGLAAAHYEVRFDGSIPLSERALFPVSHLEANGIEDARFVKFNDKDGHQIYYATYTAYNGHAIMPMLLETTDFLHFRMRTLNGSAVHNKGMALFPRRINGQFAMLSRQDDENLFIMFSDDVHSWSDPQLLIRPQELWEINKVGNCGSPIETPAGWLVLTHGVGPMRRYCIGAVLLDLEDPTRVIGRLQEPLIVPDEDRNGYVPNVVYGCGGLVHGSSLILPYAHNDQRTGVCSIELQTLLTALRR